MDNAIGRYVTRAGATELTEEREVESEFRLHVAAAPPRSLRTRSGLERSGNWLMWCRRVNRCRRNSEGMERSKSRRSGAVPTVVPPVAD